MKRIILVALLFSGIITFAQEKNVTKPLVDKRTEMATEKLVDELKLNATQAEAIKALMKSQAEKRKSNKMEISEIKNQNIEEFRAKRETEKAATKAEMKKILTADQFAKWEKITEERQQKMKEKMKECSEKKEIKDEKKNNN